MVELSDAEVVSIRAKVAKWTHGPGRVRTFTGGPLDGLRFTTADSPLYVTVAHLRDDGLVQLVYQYDGDERWAWQGIERGRRCRVGRTGRSLNRYGG